MKHEGYELTFVKARLDLDSENVSRIMPFKIAKSSDGMDENMCPVDLLPVKFVLASEHENDNADYFLRSELVSARNTPAAKPFNIEHMLEEAGSYITQPLFNTTKNTIIGHITSSYIATKDGTRISEEAIASMDASDDISRPSAESLDLIARAVLYKFYFPKTVEDVETLAKANKMFVSMECWFRGHDFLVGSEIIQSTKANEDALNEDWRKKKKVAGRRVGRILRNLIFGGVAATETPANKESVFLAAASSGTVLERLIKRHHELHILYEATGKKELEVEHLEVTRAIASIAESKK
jgi:hypothetical protein